MNKEKKLYLVRFVNQQTGEDLTEYYLATGLTQLEDEIADIINIEVLYNFNDLTDD